MLDKKRRHDSPRLMTPYVPIMPFSDCLRSISSADFTGYLLPAVLVNISQLKNAPCESVVDVGNIIPQVLKLRLVFHGSQVWDLL